MVRDSVVLGLRPDISVIGLWLVSCYGQVKVRERISLGLGSEM